MGGILFVAIQKVTNARWAGPIVRFAEAGVAFDAIAPRVEDDAIVFSLDIQPEVLDCNLAAQDDGSYKGSCIDEDGGVGTVVMVPPAG